MNNLLKALIVWLMLVAIPFQGYAAASMRTCAPHQAAPAMAMAPEHCATTGQAEHPAHAAPAGHGAPHHHAAGKCGTCAGCCISAVMAAPVAVRHVRCETPALAQFHFTDGHVEAVDLALPERPPKFSLT